jgi:hypothetical protein
MTHKFIHLPLLLPIQQIINILHAYKLRPPILLGAELHHSELIRPHAACAYIMYFSALDEVVECFHRLFDGYGLVESVDLQEVNVGRV